ncbi:MAG: cation:dicarboxylase symporter family transporter, partial [Planctomycetes bacterium]|nr:cation:dicarboxylase symporter family transporter [Planctomycetota bacterium]
MIAAAKTPWYRILYIQVLLAVVLGILAGSFFPEGAKQLKPLGDGFIKLIKMMIAPIVFCTVVHGVASVGDLRKLGRVGIKSLIYFEIVSTIALVIGLIVVNMLQPGVGITPEGSSYHADETDQNKAQSFTEKAHSLSLVEFVLNIIPSTILSAFVTGDLLQVLFVSLLIAFAIAAMGER